jgi:glycosyltransferase involved in cell wall biosynthesis
MTELKADFGIEGEGIICFAGEDWWYHHPHSKRHILTRLSRQNKVIFVNSLTLGLPSVKNRDFFLKIRRKFKSYMRWLKKAPEGPYVMSPIIIPFFGSRSIRALNRFLLLLQMRLAMMIVGIRKPILWPAIPSAVDICERLDAKAIIYQVSDKYDANEDSALSRDIIRSMDDRLKRMADAVMYSGKRLFEESNLPHRFFLEQAVDFDHFSQVASSTAPDIQAIPHPVLGYMGWMDYVMDVPLMEEVARRKPDWHWLLIGNKSNLVQVDAPNVHFIGPRPYKDLPQYLRHVDVFVLPWRINNEFTSYGSAIKVREYLATGKPAVIAPLYEYQKTPGLRLYTTVDEFISQIEQALSCDTPADRELRQSQVRDCTWDVRAREVGTLISNLVAGRGIPQADKREVLSANSVVN